MLIFFLFIIIVGLYQNSSALWVADAQLHTFHRKVSHFSEEMDSSQNEEEVAKFNEETDTGIKGVQSVHSQLLVRFKIGKDTPENNYL